MYVITEYQDYRKENYIHLHGVSDDLEKAKQRAVEILKSHFDPEGEFNFYQIYDCSRDPKSYVALQPSRRQDVKYEFSYREIVFDRLLGKTIRDLFEMLDNPVPRSMQEGKDTVITKQLFREIVETKAISDGDLEFLQSDCGCIEICLSSAIIGVVECEKI